MNRLTSITNDLKRVCSFSCSLRLIIFVFLKHQEKTMNFSTKITIPDYNFPIDYTSKIMSLGSCFAENMAAKFDYFKFQNSVNPFGIIFNPISIERIIQRIVTKELFTEKDLFFHNERWHCFEVHSDLSHADKEQLLQNLNEIIELTYTQITSFSHCIITFGTAWVYRNIASNEVVANCHKVPQNQFVKKIMSVENIIQSIQNTIDFIRSINPNCHFIFTISPVRHLKDGFVENQRSKAHLIAAIHSTHNSKFITQNYFPSYEIMMDELRDYRFYAEDMLHPSATAINYIWERFCESAINKNSFAVMHEVNSIQKAKAHLPFNPNAKSHLNFLESIQKKVETMQKTHPFMQF